MKTKKPIILIIRDGWGDNPKKKNNLIAAARTPNEDNFLKNYPHGLLAASGEAVGLDKGYQGNSEVGHLTIGSGRIIFQSLARINRDIKDASFFQNKALVETIKYCKRHKTKLHLIGLIQDQGVHAHIKHLFALLDLCQKNKFKDVYIHAITDGRDAPVTESLKHLKSLKNKLKLLGFGQIATISGRYYALDRDKRWKRTKAAYECIALGRGDKFTDALTQIKSRHQQGETDEFIRPMAAEDYHGFVKNDGVIFFNFRTDRPRQLTQAIIDKHFNGFKRKIIGIKMTTMTQYYQPMKAAVAYPNIALNNLLGECLSKAGLKQLRISETEKYAHVTFFFNGQREKAYQGESRILIHSPKVATYDLRPEMSASQISGRLVKEIKRKIYDFIVVNLVNCDMVGHTGKKAAIIKAVAAVDKAQGEIATAALKSGYTCLIIADHGNAEDKGPGVATSHTINPVPMILVSEDKALKNAKIIQPAGLKDIAPTILKIMGLKIPKEMDGHNLLKI